jgi:hypothetical protein
MAPVLINGLCLFVLFMLWYHMVYGTIWYGTIVAYNFSQEYL